MRGDKVLTLVRQEIERLEKIEAALVKEQYVDFGARLHASAIHLDNVDGKLKERIKQELGVGPHTGVRATAIVSPRTREVLKTKEMQIELRPEIWQPYIKTIEYLDVTYKFVG